MRDAFFSLNKSHAHTASRSINAYGKLPDAPSSVLPWPDPVLLLPSVACTRNSPSRVCLLPVVASWDQPHQLPACCTRCFRAPCRIRSDLPSNCYGRSRTLTLPLPIDPIAVSLLLSDYFFAFRRIPIWLSPHVAMICFCADNS